MRSAAALAAAPGAALPATTRIKYHETAFPGLDEGKTAVHVKGFGRSLDFSDANTAAAEKLMIDMLVERAPDCLVFDGDDLRPDSFTAVIPKVARLVDPRPQVVAFLRREDANRFAASWEFEQPDLDLDRLDVYLQPDSLNWQELGEAALLQTGATDAYCLGGGPTLEFEFETCPETVRFHLFSVTRPLKDGSGVEFPTLLKFTASKRLLVHLGPTPTDTVENTQASRKRKAPDDKSDAAAAASASTEQEESASGAQDEEKKKGKSCANVDDRKAEED